MQISLEKRVVEMKEDTSEQDILSFLSGKYCIGCGLDLRGQTVNKCPQCGHDQRTSIAKKITNPHDMARATISFSFNISTTNNTLRCRVYTIGRSLRFHCARLQDSFEGTGPSAVTQNTRKFGNQLSVRELEK